MQVWFFDIDGTLLDTGGAGSAAMVGTVAREFAKPAEAHGVAFAGRTDMGITRDLFAAHQVPFTDTHLAKFRTAYLTSLAEELQTRPGRILPGVLACLRAIDDCVGAHLGLLTGNIELAARMKLEHYGLADYFRFGGFGDDHVDRESVASAAMESAELHLDQSVDRQQVWVVGDTPHDVRCGRAIGARVIAVATGRHTCEELMDQSPDMLLEDLSDTPRLIDLLPN